MKVWRAAFDVFRSFKLQVFEEGEEGLRKERTEAYMRRREGERLYFLVWREARAERREEPLYINFMVLWSETNVGGKVRRFEQLRGVEG